MECFDGRAHLGLTCRELFYWLTHDGASCSAEKQSVTLRVRGDLSCNPTTVHRWICRWENEVKRGEGKFTVSHGAGSTDGKELCTQSHWILSALQVFSVPPPMFCVRLEMAMTTSQMQTWETENTTLSFMRSCYLINSREGACFFPAFREKTPMAGVQFLGLWISEDRGVS